MKLPSEELSWEEAVSRYLLDNRDYFERHPELLEALRVPHAGRGRAVSLLERQIEVLRARLTAKERDWQTFVGVARDNDALAEKLHRLAVALIDAASIDDVFGSFYDLGRHELALDAVVIRVAIDGGALAGRTEFVAPDDSRLRQALVIAGEQPLCGPVAVLGDVRSLLGGEEAEMRSVALVPMRDPVRAGLLLFASRDRQRFSAGIGTVYLARIGELLMRASARHLNGR
ncbi:MAG: DUF484 family protein [Acidiferrobacter sp.]